MQIIFLILVSFLTPFAHSASKTPLHPSVKVALAPFKIEGKKSYADFLKKVSDQVIDAKAKNADLIVFPELFIADLLEAEEKISPLIEQMKLLAKNTSPKLITDLTALAKKHSIYIVGGSFPRIIKERIVNTSVFITSSGDTHFQDKVFITPDEKIWKWSGGDRIHVIDTPIGRIAVLICYDVEFPLISNQLAKHSPEIIIVPSMTDSEAGFRRVRWTAQARAIEHRAYVLHVGTTGNPDPSWPHYAQASALSPSEKGFPGLLKEGKINSSEILFVSLDLNQLREARSKVGIHPAKDQSTRSIHLNVQTN
jgi:predicted amidohydrolase